MQCRICDHQNLELAINLGMQPWGNHFLTKNELGKEPFYPLQVVVCTKCQGAQLDYTVKKEVMFSNHTYLSGMTKSLKRHFDGLAKEVDKLFGPSTKQKSILDIGSNDGTQLQSYKDLGYEVLGVESCKQTADIANSNDIPTLHAFFNLETAKEIGKEFDIINASGVFFHLEELHSVTEAIKKHLKQKGIFVVQFIYMKSIMDNLAFDQIYHEHLLYYTLKSLSTLLQRHGLELFDCYLSSIHGGSIMGFVSHKGSFSKTSRLHEMLQKEEKSHCNDISSYLSLAKEIKNIKERDLAFLHQKKKQKKRIFGMGAPVKGNTLLNYFGIGPDLLECLVEKNELRKGLYSPGMHIPICIEKELPEFPDIYYGLAWNFKKEILKNHQDAIKNGLQFYFPVEVDG